MAAERPRLRVQILSSGPLCRNPRVLKEATALGRAGYDTIVVTIANLARFETLDADLLQDAPFRKIVLDRQMVPAVTRILSNVDRAVTWLARRCLRWGVDVPQALGPYRGLLRLARRHPADLTIVHTELPFCIGRQLQREGRRVAADFEDWHSRDLLDEAQLGRPRRLLQLVERDLLREGAYCSTTSNAMANALARAYDAKKPIVIRNTFPLQPRPQIGPKSAVPSFIWFSQTIGPGRGLEPFITAWSRMKHDTHLVLLGDVGRAYRDSLVRLAPNRTIRFLPLVAPSDLPATLATHEIGLALEPSNPDNKNLTISNKIFQYMNAGLAVVATATAGQREVLSEAPKAGLIVDFERSDVGDALDALVADPSTLAAMRTAARSAAEQNFSWELEQPRLLEAVEAALSRPARESHRRS